VPADKEKTDTSSYYLDRLDRIEAALQALLERQAVKDWYSTEEVAQILRKAEFTVREWCRLGRVRGEKKGSGRGKHRGWVISHEELQRIQREGLLPPTTRG
jgi:transposase